MRYVLLALLALALFVTAALWSKLSAIIKYADGEFSLTFKLWFFKYSIDGAERRKEKPKKTKKQEPAKAEAEENASDESASEKHGKGRTEKDEKSLKEKIKNGLSLFKGGKRAAGRLFRYLKRKIDITKIDIRCRFGTGDAAATGTVCGAVWGLIGNIYIIFGKYFNLSFPSIDLVPVFEHKIFEIEAESIIRVRPAHIINAAVLALFTYLMYERKATVKEKRKKINSVKSEKI